MLGVFEGSWVLYGVGSSVYASSVFTHEGQLVIHDYTPVARVRIVQYDYEPNDALIARDAACRLRFSRLRKLNLLRGLPAEGAPAPGSKKTRIAKTNPYLTL